MIKNIFIIEKKETTITDFIKFWEKVYINFNTSIKYRDKEYYWANIGIKDKDLIPLTRDNIDYLFQWKLGKEKFFQREINIIDNVKNNLENLNNFRKIPNPNWESFQDFYQTITASCFKTNAPILSIFVIHIAHPFKFPIIDQHVIRAFKYIKGIDKSQPKPKDYLELYKKYINFFNELTTKSGLSFRSIDKALWAFGKFLKNENFKNLIF